MFLPYIYLKILLQIFLVRYMLFHKEQDLLHFYKQKGHCSLQNQFAEFHLERYLSDLPLF